MSDVTDYTSLITSEHQSAPKYMAMVAAVAQCFVDQQNLLLSIPEAFDLDNAVGAQLDAVGLWVGVTRNIQTPLSGVYFSFDIAGVGFDEGFWKGPFDPDSGITSLDDETFLLLIRTRIAANHWDGTTDSLADILQSLFGDETTVFVQDNCDMSITFGIVGQMPNVVQCALLEGGYIPLKPSTISATYVFASIPEMPIFGFDVENSNISGFDGSCWGASSITPSRVIDFNFILGTSTLG